MTVSASRRRRVLVEDDDVRQEAALEDAKGNRPRPARFIRADLMLRVGNPVRAKRGFGVPERVGLCEEERDRVLAVPPEQVAVELEDDVLARAFRVASDLPAGQRAVIERALIRLLPAEERIARWVAAHHGRKVPMRVVAAEVGLARETVFRVLARIRRARCAK